MSGIFFERSRMSLLLEARAGLYFQKPADTGEGTSEITFTEVGGGSLATGTDDISLIRHDNIHTPGPIDLGGGSDKLVENEDNRYTPTD